MTKPGEWKGGKLTLASREKLATLQDNPDEFLDWWTNVLERAASGKSIYTIAEEEKLTIGVFTRWVRENKSRKDDFEEAQAIYAEKLVAETIDIADGTQSVKVRMLDKATGAPVLDDNGEVVMVEYYPDSKTNRNRINARQWAASKFNRDRFGDRMDVNVHHTVDVKIAIADARKRSIGRDITQQVEQLPEAKE